MIEQNSPRKLSKKEIAGRLITVAAAGGAPGGAVAGGGIGLVKDINEYLTKYYHQNPYTFEQTYDIRLAPMPELPSQMSSLSNLNTSNLEVTRQPINRDGSRESNPPRQIRSRNDSDENKPKWAPTQPTSTQESTSTKTSTEESTPTEEMTSTQPTPTEESTPTTESSPTNTETQQSTATSTESEIPSSTSTPNATPTAISTEKNKNKPPANKEQTPNLNIGITPSPQAMQATGSEESLRPQIKFGFDNTFKGIKDGVTKGALVSVGSATIYAINRKQFRGSPPSKPAR